MHREWLQQEREKEQKQADLDDILQQLRILTNLAIRDRNPNWKVTYDRLMARLREHDSDDQWEQDKNKFDDRNEAKQRQHQRWLARQSTIEAPQSGNSSSRSRSREREESLGLPIPHAQRQQQSHRQSIEMSVIFENEEVEPQNDHEDSESSKSRSITPIDENGRQQSPSKTPEQVERKEKSRSPSKSRSKTPTHSNDKQQSEEILPDFDDAEPQLPSNLGLEPPMIPDRAESEPITILDDDKEDDRAESAPPDQIREIIEIDDSDGDSSESSDISIDNRFTGKRAWLKDIDQSKRKLVRFVLELLTAYGKVIYGDRTIHLSWKREVLLAIGMNPDEFDKLKLNYNNIKQGEPFSISQMKQRERQLQSRELAGIRGKTTFALAYTQKEDNLENDNQFLSEMNTFLYEKGISYRIMYYLTVKECKFKIKRASESRGIPFVFVRNDDNRQLEKDLREVRKRFLKYAYKLNIVDGIDDIEIEAVRRVDQIRYGTQPYRPEQRNVYAARPSTVHMQDYERTVTYVPILPQRIEQLSPQPSQTGSTQAQETIEIGKDETRRIVITDNSITVTPIRIHRTYQTQAFNIARQPGRRRQDRQDIEDDGQRGPDEEVDGDDEKMPAWLRRHVEQQGRAMTTMIRILANQDEARNRPNANNTRQREFEKYLERMRIEHDLKIEIRNKLGETGTDRIWRQIRQLHWYEEVERFATKSKLRDHDQALLVKIVAENSLVNRPLQDYHDSVRENGQFDSVI